MTFWDACRHEKVIRLRFAIAVGGGGGPAPLWGRWWRETHSSGLSINERAFPVTCHVTVAVLGAAAPPPPTHTDKMQVHDTLHLQALPISPAGGGVGTPLWSPCDSQDTSPNSAPDSPPSALFLCFSLIGLFPFSS